MAPSAIQTFLFGGEPNAYPRVQGVPWTGAELVGRLFLAGIFLVSGIAKLADPAGTAQHMAAQGIDGISVFLPIAAIVEIVGALSLITGTFARAGALLLTMFLIPTTLIFHDFWNYQEMGARVMQMANFMKNLALIGGLTLVLAHGASRLSIDHKLERRLATTPS